MAVRALLTGGGTGGHLYPALNLAEALRRADPGTELYYVGARRGVEARELPGRDLPHQLLPVHPLRRSRPWRNWRLLASAPAVLLGVRRIFRDFRPDVVVGTGGYASGPAVLWAAVSRCPLVLQEQNAHPGLVTRLMARRADQVHLGFPEARGRLGTGGGTEVFAHGNPVATAPPAGGTGAGSETGSAEGDGFRWPRGRVLLAVGGSQGARGLNRALLRDLEEVRAWPADLSLVWIAGPDWAEEVSDRLERLPWRDRIRVLPYLEDLGRRLGGVTLAVSRAGAMFVSELAAHGVPSVLVPFPGAAGSHQEANARALAEAGAAVICREDELRRGDLWRLAAALLSDGERLRRMAGAAAERGRPDAAERIAADVLRLAGRGDGPGPGVGGTEAPESGGRRPVPAGQPSGRAGKDAPGDRDEGGADG